MKTPALLFSLALLAVSLVMINPAAAQSRGGVGIGGQIGDPSGVTLKFATSRGYALDFLAAWDLNDDFFFLNVHALYERSLGTEPGLNFFFGPGGFVGFFDGNGRGNDDAVVGISGTFGVNYYIDRFELFAQLTPRLALIPETDGDLGGGVGVRFYF